MRNKQRRIRRSRFPETVDPLQQRTRHYEHLLRRYEGGLDWVTKLKSHTSCVNAVNFSQQGGRWMVSGGDDLRILLWDLHQPSVKKPQHTFVGPTRNIFELAFTTTNKSLLCGGVDSVVRRYDFERIGESFDPDPVAVFRQHNESIRGIAPHIVNDELYMTASQEGRLFFHDTRSPTPAGHLISKEGWVGLQFHPRLEHLFLGATEHKNGRITLFDIRKCFGKDASTSEDKELTRYLTMPIGDKPISSNTCDIAFDRSGERFASVNQGHYPVVYTLSDSYPIAICTAARRPDGETVAPNERNYNNSCTIKHVSFGGPPATVPHSYSSPKTASSDTDQFLATGSDDFRGYVWKIPSTSYLLDQRQELDDGDDHPTGKFGYKYSAIDTMRIPVHLEQPSFRLGGHQSIVNTARWHPVLPRIATCGIESKVVLHDCSDVLEGSEKVGSEKVRKRTGRISNWRYNGSVGSLARREVTGETSEEISSDEGKSTILYFDRTLATDDDERMSLERRLRRQPQMRNPFEDDDDEEEDEDDFRGGPGGMDDSLQAMIARADRARLMAMFSRILAAAGRRGDRDDEEEEEEEENENENENEHEREEDDNEETDGHDVGRLAVMDHLLMLASADGLGSFDEEDEDEEEGETTMDITE